MDEIRDIAVPPETPTKSVQSLEDIGNLLEEYRQALKGQRESLLFFESDEHWRNIIHSVLVYKGYDVDTASDESAFLDGLSQSRPRLVLIDIDAPDDSGWRLLEEAIRNGVATVALTASEEAAVSSRALTAGAAEVITKPFIPVEFTSKIRKAWKRNDSHDSRKV